MSNLEKSMTKLLKTMSEYEKTVKKADELLLSLVSVLKGLEKIK